MKKLMMVAALTVASLGASAQVYVGGGLNIHSYDNGYEGDAKSLIRFVPEVGYNLDDKMSIGVQVGFGTKSYEDVSATDSYTEWVIKPYLRYKFVQAGNFSVFGDATIGYGQEKTSPKVGDDMTYNKWTFGVRPGISYNLSDRFSLVSTIGWLGYTTKKLDADNAKTASDFGLDLSGENITFSLFYNF